MPLTAGQIIALATESAHSPGKTAQALNLLNSILSDVCQERDFAEARGQFLFNFMPVYRPVTGPARASRWGSAIWGENRWGATGPVGGVVDVWPGAQFGSGPYLMPLDYLRLSGSSGSHGAQRSFIWWLDGVPYPVIPTDLAEFDMQVQQTGLQSYVWLSATDMSAPIDDRILLQTTGDLVAGADRVENLGSTVRLVPGNVLGVAGQGIQPGTMLADFRPQTTPGVLGSTDQGLGTNATGALATAASGGWATLSQPAVATITGASIFFGYTPVIFIYPPPSGTQQAMIRYQKQMPPLVDTTRHPWMHNDGYLLEKLIGMLCRLNDDARADQLLGGPGQPGSAEANLTNFLAMKDDEQSHPKRVELDRRVFGRQISNLGITKKVGW